LFQIAILSAKKLFQPTAVKALTRAVWCPSIINPAQAYNTRSTTPSCTARQRVDAHNANMWRLSAEVVCRENHHHRRQSVNLRSAALTQTLWHLPLRPSLGQFGTYRAVTRGKGR